MASEAVGKLEAHGEEKSGALRSRVRKGTCRDCHSRFRAGERATNGAICTATGGSHRQVCVHDAARTSRVIGHEHRTPSGGIFPEKARGSAKVVGPRRFDVPSTPPIESSSQAVGPTAGKAQIRSDSESRRKRLELDVPLPDHPCVVGDGGPDRARVRAHRREAEHHDRDSYVPAPHVARCTPIAARTPA